MAIIQQWRMLQHGNLGQCSPASAHGRCVVTALSCIQWKAHHKFHMSLVGTWPINTKNVTFNVWSTWGWILEMCQEDENKDEITVDHYDPQTKTKSMQWQLFGSPSPWKLTHILCRSAFVGLCPTHNILRDQGDSLCCHMGNSTPEHRPEDKSTLTTSLPIWLNNSGYLLSCIQNLLNQVQYPLPLLSHNIYILIEIAVWPTWFAVSKISFYWQCI